MSNASNDPNRSESQTTDDLRPMFLPGNLDLGALAEDHRAAIVSVVNPLNRECVIEAESALEAAIGESVAFSKMLELVSQLDMASRLSPDGQSLEMPSAESIDQALKLAGSFRKDLGMLIRVREHESKRQLARIELELENGKNDDQQNGNS
jgi:hypothetical protein